MPYAVYKNGTRIRTYDDPVRALIHVARAREADPENLYRAVNKNNERHRKIKNRR